MSDQGTALLRAIEEGFEADVPDGGARRILLASMEVFARKGLHGTKIGDIARHAGFSQGFVYHYFPTKDAIYQRILALAADGAARAVGLAMALEGTPADRIRWLTEALLCPDSLSTQHWRLLLLQASMPDALPADTAEELRRRNAQLVLQFAELLQEGQQAGQIAPLEPLTLAVTYFAVMQGAGMMLAQSTVPLPFVPIDRLLRFLWSEEGLNNG